MDLETRLLKVTQPPDACPAIAEAAQLLREGALVAFPTETVYGLGGDALRPGVVDKIFAAKSRPADNPLIVHITDADGVGRFCESRPAVFQALADAFWPGPLTLVLPANSRAREAVTRGLDTVALRVPAHPVAQALLRAADLGLAAPSANLSGRPSPTEAAHVLHDLQGRIPLILDGGACEVGIESTVLDLSVPRPTILRPGTVTAEALAEVLGYAPTLAQGEEAKRRTPGARYRHYSPTVPVVLVMPAVDDYGFKRLIGYLGRKGPVAYMGPRRPPYRVIHQPAGRKTMARVLYGCLRRWEKENVTAIVIESVSTLHEGASLMDRLTKAASRVFEDRAAVMRFIDEEGTL